MNKKPFIIDIHDGDLPNLAADTGNTFGIEFSHTDIWQDDSIETIKLLNSINEKLDTIIRIIQQNGRG